jgi:AMMECR1 domain-containing protein
MNGVGFERQLMDIGRGQHQWRVACILALAVVFILNPIAWSDALPLPALVRQTMAFYFENTPGVDNPAGYQNFIKHLPQVAASYRQSVGVFVTLSHQGKPRACWGSAFPRYNNVTEATVYATLGALTKEYRYKPISPDEWRQLKPQVTVIKALEPIRNLHGQNPFYDGLMVRQNGRSGVILPGEARDATYQLMLCKLKAGIQPGQKFQLYRMIADVYH